MTSYELIILHKKLSVTSRIFSVNVTQSTVSSSEEILDKKLHFLCSVISCLV